MEYKYVYTDKCWFKENCIRQEQIGCDSSCPIRSEFDYLINTSNIPEFYKEKIILYAADKDYDAFVTLRNIQQDIETFVEQGRTLYIWSTNKGNAKSSWACKLLNTYLAVMCYGNNYKDLAWFEYAPSFVLMAKEFQNDERQIHIENLCKRAFCIIDDIGAICPSNYDISVLSDVINSRYSNSKSTIYTSNLSPKSLASNIGERLADRVLSDIVIELKGSGHRKSTNKYERK